MSQARLALAVLLVAVSLLRAAPAPAALELQDVKSLELASGMTVLLLEDRNFPVVSVQIVYRVGARNETTGKTGLAHFLEHMAFRETENFPDTDVVSRIYAVGGEWHGYTWTDQTTYFATVPREHWELLLEIEADRMFRLVLDPATIEAEKGAVLAEMHLYENSPASMLIDALAFSSFVAHPYRNNTIGWESDVRSFTVDDVRGFYEEHYHPANAVLAVVGDIDAAEVEARIETLFASGERRHATPLPHTDEPEQRGTRRVAINGATPGHEFRVGYRAPSVGHPDFAPFLVLQEMLAASSGVNFLQNDWGTPARAGRLLHGAASNLTSWFPPSAQDYLFAIGGSAGPAGEERDVEHAIENAVSALRDRVPDDELVDDAIGTVLDELVFDVQTTEDAAHQLASFASLDALDVLLTLPARLRRVTGGDVTRVANTWLRTERRTIAWYRSKELTLTPSKRDAPAARIEPTSRGAVDESPAAQVAFRRLGNGLPAIVVRSDFAPAVYLKAVVPGRTLSNGSFVAGDPEPGLLSWNEMARSGELPALAGRAADALKRAQHVGTSPTPASLDPATRLQEEMLALMSMPAAAADAPVAPAAVIVAGDVSVDEAFAVLQTSFGEFDVATAPARTGARSLEAGRKAVLLERPVAQSRLGYLVAAPAPTGPDHAAWRILQYVFAHDYEGRLGKAAISDRGLAYYIDARYASDGGPGWTSLSIGVDTEKLEALEALLAAELLRLETTPPTPSEVAEAKRHLIGRAISAAQSNEELATSVSRHYLRHGELPSLESLARQLDAVTVRDVAALAPRFARGVTIAVMPGTNPERR